MSNELTTPEPDDDGFIGSINSGRLIKGSLARWSDSNGWTDRDGLALPSPVLVVAIDEALQRWEDNKPEIIRGRPLPNTEDLNAAIPVSEWETGIDGKPRPPWAHVVVVYLVDLNSGAFFTYVAATLGAHMAYEALKEATITMRALRGTRVLPVVNLAERPMKTNFGMRKRPHFGIIEWKSPGGSDRTVPPPSPTPRIAGPANQPAPARAATATPYQAKPKPQLGEVAGSTLAAMGDVKPVTTAEILDDDLPF